MINLSSHFFTLLFSKRFHRPSIAPLRSPEPVCSPDINVPPQASDASDEPPKAAEFAEGFGLRPAGLYNSRGISSDSRPPFRSTNIDTCPPVTSETQHSHACSEASSHLFISTESLTGALPVYSPVTHRDFYIQTISIQRTYATVRSACDISARAQTPRDQLHNG